MYADPEGCLEGGPVPLRPLLRSRRLSCNRASWKHPLIEMYSARMGPPGNCQSAIAALSSADVPGHARLLCAVRPRAPCAGAFIRRTLLILFVVTIQSTTE